MTCIFGDGAINRGPFLEGLNWAGVWKLPILFVCEDNGFAATTRTRAMTSGKGPAARAESFGIPAASVDGNDLLAVDEMVRRLLGEIRAGGGPRFLLCKTYRLTGHTGADAGGYRSKEEVRRPGRAIRWRARAICLPPPASRRAISPRPRRARARRSTLRSRRPRPRPIRR